VRVDGRDRMQVSVIVPTYNRVKDLDECLDSIIAQTKLPKEVLVIDNGMDARTKDLIERREREFEEKGIILKYVKNEIENSLTVAKNIAVKYSTGDIMSFLDDDLVLDKTYYEEILKIYREKPNPLGVDGYDYSGKKGKGVIVNLMRMFIKLFQISSFLEEDK
jgi:glycosyltransferase involved in cell wall biosynthesis